MRKSIMLAAASLMLVGLTAAAAPVSLIQNEYNFAKAVADHGVRDGFLMYLDKQAITLAPQPANAFDIYTKRKPSDTKLSWYPSFAILSASSDFGVDTGPWTASWIEGGKQQKAYGDWLTVWHRNKDGHWLVLFDGGVDHDAPAKPPIALVKDAKITQLTSPGQVVDMDKVRWTLERAEQLFSDTEIESSPRAAYAGQADAAIHLLEEGHQPVTGLPAVMQTMSVQPGGWQWVPSGGSVAPSADLGYIYGLIYTAKDDDHKTPLGSYMHVWKRDQGNWKLLIDEELPVPPQKQ
jgi:ketosteroid isomerase-like protein